MPQPAQTRVEGLDSPSAPGVAPGAGSEVTGAFRPDADACLAALSHTFGYSSFRPHQREIVESVLAGRDVFAVMPTGGGKSLCYQLPANILPGTAVIISPLIALMKDQVDAARENNLAADFLNSSLTSAQATAVFRRMYAGSLDLLYISPERFALDSFVAALKKVPIAFFAVDEAHCLSEWGHDFRPDYLALSGIRRHFPGIAIAAFTATATSVVGRDILARLGLQDPFLVRASFNRPNLFYEVRPKRQVETQILDYLEEHPEEPGIIYRTTRDAVEKTAAYLSGKGLRALPYHAGLPQETRQRNQEAFNRDESQIMVATIAFGMGIDKSNVRFVIHADLPKNIEGYYQETGRAGRDGDPSLCLLFYGGGDIPKLRHFMDQIPDEREREQALQKLNRMAEFASRYQCRRRQLLAYFEENFPGDNCASCDVCTGRAETADATREAQMVLSALVRTGERFGAAHIVDVLLGADTKKIRETGHDQIKTYGVGKHRDRGYWRFLIGELMGRGILALDDGPYPILKLTEACLPFLKGEGRLDILDMPKAGKTKTRGDGLGQVQPGASEEGPDGDLFDRLRALRKALAQRQGVPPYIVFSDKTLHEMSRHKPVTLAALREIPGVGDAKRDRYGTDFVQEIRAHLDSGSG